MSDSRYALFYIIYRLEKKDCTSDFVVPPPRLEMRSTIIRVERLSNAHPWNIYLVTNDQDHMSL